MMQFSDKEIIHITHVIPGDLWAGAESQVFYTLKKLNQLAECKVDIVLFNKGELYRRLNIEGVPTHYKDEHKFSSVRLCFWLKSILSRGKPSVVHVHGYKSHILVSITKLLFRGRYAIIRTIHGQLSPPSIKSGIKSFSLLKLEALLLKRFTHSIIAVSEDIVEYLLSRYPGNNIVHINNGVYIEQENNVARFQLSRKRFNISEDVFWVATAVRFVEVKNLAMLLRVAECLMKNGVNNVAISIFGEGPLYEPIQIEIKKRGLSSSIFMHGHVNDVSQVFRELDCFVLTSFSEGLPMSLLEAMSYGVVPVCTRVGGMKEVITAESGFLVDSDNEEQMASSIISLQDNKEQMKNMSAAAKQRVIDHYSIDQMVNKLMAVYYSVCRNV